MKSSREWAFHIPIIAIWRRDLFRNLRHIRLFMSVAAFSLIFGLIVYSNWPRPQSPPELAGAASSMIAFGAGYGLLFLIAVVFPSLGGACVVVEREENTFDLLALAPIPSWALALGKMLSLLTIFFILFLVCMPFVATVFFLVGLDWGAFLGIFFILACTALSSASVSVLASACSRRSNQGAALALCLVAGVYGIVFLPVFVVMQILGYMPALMQIMSLSVFMSPVMGMTTLQTSPLRPLGLYQMLFLTAVYHLIVAALGVLGAGLQIRRGLGPELPPASEDKPRTLRDRMRRLYIGSVPKHGPIPDMQNPVFARETRHAIVTRLGLRRRVLIIALLVALGVVYGIYRNSRLWSVQEGFPMYVFVQLLVFCVAGMMVPATSITGERERDTADMLSMTLLRPWQVILGKFLAGLRVFVPIVIVSVAGFVLLAVSTRTQPGHLDRTLAAFGTLCVCGLLSACLAMLASVLAKRSATAISLSLGLSSLVYFGFYLIAGALVTIVIRPISSDYTMQRSTLEVLMWMSPAICGFANIVDQTTRHNYLNAMWVLNILTFTGVSVGVLILSVRIHARRVSRALPGAQGGAG